MFSEILKIIPIIDNARAKTLENSLHGRFKRVAKGFGKALNFAIKGTILGISLGLLQKLLDPIKEIEERVNKLLDDGSDLVDNAADFGATAGEMKRLQDIGGALGVKPEQLKDMLTKYQDAIEGAKKEMLEKGSIESASGQAVSKYINDSNMVESFINYLKGLQATQPQSIIKDGRRVDLGLQTQQTLQENVFGKKFGAAQNRLMMADFNAIANQTGSSDTKGMSARFERVARLAEMQRIGAIRSENKYGAQQMDAINPSMITGLQQIQDKKEADLADKMRKFDTLKKADELMTKITEVVTKMNELILEAFAFIRRFTEKKTASEVILGKQQEKIERTKASRESGIMKTLNNYRNKGDF